MSLLDMSNHYFTTSSKDLTTIMMPCLERFKINFFRYLKLYNDGSRINLSTDPEWTIYFYKNKFHELAWYDKGVPKQYSSVRSIWDDKRLTEDNVVGFAGRTIFNINHGYSIIRAQSDFCEVFCFATTEDNFEINYIYEKYPEYFDEVIFYFKQHAHFILEKAELCKIVLPMQIMLDDEKSNDLVDVDYANISRYYIEYEGDSTYLTRAEYNCICLWLSNKTMKEISHILDVSPRTVATHIENVKGKLNINFKSQLFVILQKIGIYDTMFKYGTKLQIGSMK